MTEVDDMACKVVQDVTHTCKSLKTFKIDTCFCFGAGVVLDAISWGRTHGAGASIAHDAQTESRGERAAGGCGNRWLNINDRRVMC